MPSFFFFQTFFFQFFPFFPLMKFSKKKDRTEREESEVLTKRIAACNSLFMVHQMGKWEWRQRSDGWGKIGRGNSLFPEKSETIAFFRARQRFKTMWHRVRARLYVEVRFFFRKKAIDCGFSNVRLVEMSIPITNYNWCIRAKYQSFISRL